MLDRKRIQELARGMDDVPPLSDEQCRDLSDLFTGKPITSTHAVEATFEADDDVPGTAAETLDMILDENNGGHFTSQDYRGQKLNVVFDVQALSRGSEASRHAGAINAAGSTLETLLNVLGDVWALTATTVHANSFDMDPAL